MNDQVNPDPLVDDQKTIEDLQPLGIRIDGPVMLNNRLVAGGQTLMVGGDISGADAKHLAENAGCRILRADGEHCTFDDLNKLIKSVDQRQTGAIDPDEEGEPDLDEEPPLDDDEDDADQDDDEDSDIDPDEDEYDEDESED
jgi:hypothetical protein